MQFANNPQYASVADTTADVKKDTTNSKILLYPDALPPQYQTGFLVNSDQALSAQIGVTGVGLGVEMIYTAAETRSFISLEMGTLQSDGFSDIRTKLMTSLTYGYKANISALSGNDSAVPKNFLGRPELYVRLGPGISTLSVDRQILGERESERLIGFHTFTMIGGSIQLAERSRLNVELGWRGLWFPGSDQLNFISGPRASFGFSFNGGGGTGIDPVSW